MQILFQFNFVYFLKKNQIWLNLGILNRFTFLSFTVLAFDIMVDRIELKEKKEKSLNSDIWLNQMRHLKNDIQKTRLEIRKKKQLCFKMSLKKASINFFLLKKWNQ